MANYCPQCGSPVNPNNAFCENCGAKLILPDEPKHEAPAPNPAQTGAAIPNEPKKASGKRLAPVIFGLTAVLLVALFLLLRQKKTPEPEEVPNTVHTPEIAIPSAAASTPEPDIPQGTGDFLTYGIPADAVQNRTYRYPGTYDDAPEERIYGSLIFTNYTSSPVNQSILDFGKDNNMVLDGYLVCELDSEISFTGPDVSDRGVVVSRYTGDFHDPALMENTIDSFTDNYGDVCYFYEIDNHGNRQVVYFYIESYWDDDGTTAVYHENATFLVPEDYDGAVRGFISPQIENIYEQHDPDEVFFFRINSNQ